MLLAMFARELAGLPILIFQGLLILSFLASPPTMDALTLATTLMQPLALLLTRSVLFRLIRTRKVLLIANRVL